MSTAVAQKVINFSCPIHLHGWDGGHQEITTPICPKWAPPLTGPWVAPQMLGTVKKESRGGDGLSWVMVGCWIIKRKESPPRFYNAIRAVINFQSILCYWNLKSAKGAGHSTDLIDRWCPGLPWPCSAHDLVKVSLASTSGTRTQLKSGISKPGVFAWPSRPLAVERQSWERHCDLKSRKCGLPTFFLATWHLGILLKHLLEVETGK